jgi:UDP-N-acetylglucosamine:LPS N-acetylglucosamine transferase
VQAGRTYIFAGGGTGGHLFPGIAVAEELRAREPEARLLFVGTERAIERRIIGEFGCEHRELPAEPSTTLRRRPWRFARRTWRGFRNALAILDESPVAAVVGLGGYASVPMV